MPSLMHIAEMGARAGAHVLVEHAGSLGDVRTKSSSTDFVTDVDVAAGIAVVRAILKDDPGARFVVEEPEVYEATGCEQGDPFGDRVWVIDPLDGTTSYIHGFPCYSVSVGLVEGGQPVAAAVFNAASGESFTAAAAQGAFRDGQPVHVSESHEISEALLVTGFPYDRGRPLDRQLAVLTSVLHRGVHGIRRDGSAAVDLTHVACGRADGYWEFGLQPWDTAAGALIVTEAGGVVTAVDGSPWRPEGNLGVIAANARLHDTLVRLIAETEEPAE